MSGAPLLFGSKNTGANERREDGRRGSRSAAFPRCRTVPALGWFPLSHDPVTSSQLGAGPGGLDCDAPHRWAGEGTRPPRLSADIISADVNCQSQTTKTGTAGNLLQIFRDLRDV